MGSFVLYRMLTACSMLLIKDCGEVQRGVSMMYRTTVGELLANSSVKRRELSKQQMKERLSTTRAQTRAKVKCNRC